MVWINFQEQHALLFHSILSNLSAIFDVTFPCQRVRDLLIKKNTRESRVSLSSQTSQNVNTTVLQPSMNCAQTWMRVKIKKMTRIKHFDGPSSCQTGH